MRIQNLIPLTIRKSLGNWCHQQAALREKRALLRSLQGTGVTCNICHWEGAKFTDDPWHAGTVCPNCNSQVRHRLFVAVLDGKTHFPEFQEKSLFNNKTVLHFAPERQLRHRIKSASQHYLSCDYERGDVDLQLNMSSMPSIATASFDIVILFDVLEHVPNDHAAMAELYRILKPGGMAIITAPQKDSPSQTDESETALSPEEALHRFGQKDHLRIYGDDLAIRLEEAGFMLCIIDASSFSQEDINRFVLLPPKISSHPLATNQRRLYFARKRDD